MIGAETPGSVYAVSTSNGENGDSDNEAKEMKAEQPAFAHFANVLPGPLYSMMGVLALLDPPSALRRIVVKRILVQGLMVFLHTPASMVRRSDTRVVGVNGTLGELETKWFLAGGYPTTLITVMVSIVYLLCFCTTIIKLWDFFDDAGHDFICKISTLPAGKRKALRASSASAAIFVVVWTILMLWMTGVVTSIAISSMDNSPEFGLTEFSPSAYRVYLVIVSVATGIFFVLVGFTAVIIGIVMIALTHVQVANIEKASKSIEAEIYNVDPTLHGVGKQGLGQKISSIMDETHAEFRRGAHLFSQAGVWCVGWIAIFAIFGFSVATELQPGLNFMYLAHIIGMVLCAGCCIFVLGYGLLPSLAWTKLIYALRDPRCIEAITRHGLPADAIVEGISVRMPVMAWKFNGIVITVGVYQSVLAAFLTTLGVIIASLVRNFEI